MKFLFTGTLAMLLALPLISQHVFATDEIQEEQEKSEEEKTYGQESVPASEEAEMQEEEPMILPEDSARPAPIEEPEFEE